MWVFYLDVETYRPRNEDIFRREKIIVIGVLEDWTPYKPESSKIWDGHSVKFHYFAEWELGGERNVVLQFYDYLRRLVQDQKNNRIDFLSVIGFNILRFDVLLLIQKGVEYNVETLPNLNELWHNTFTIDYFQTSLPFHNMKFKDLKLEYLVEKARSSGIDVPEPFGYGNEVKEWYDNKEYDKIIKHLEMDLKIVRVIDLNYKRIYGI
ncbi:MAG: hypothetical protein QW348_06850 [Ignisphaera sp.]